MADLVRTRQEQVYDIIKDIKDPEKPDTLEELGVVSEDNIHIEILEKYSHINVIFVPTVPHCHLATLIGLCIRVKLERDLPYKFKLDIGVKEGTHKTASEITKQINDKERVAAAMENRSLCDMVDQCITPYDY
ncbi:cytosolic iron-sulfur assembly component 2A-like [Ornithodoros turicata]